MDDIQQPQIIDDKGNPADIPPELVQKAIQSGKYSFLKGDQIPVLDQSGKPASIPAEQAVDAFNAQGYQYEPLESQQNRHLETKYGEGTGNELRAGAEGFARGATLGGSDYALQALGSDQEGLREREKRNPISSTGGNIGGVIAPLLLSGGTATAAEAAASAAARAAKLGLGAEETAQAVKAAVEASKLGAKQLIPSVGVSRLGSEVTEGVGNLIGSDGAKTLAQKVLASGLTHGAGGLVEGMAYGGGNAVSESALGETPITAERIAAHVGLGALIGAGAGGVLGALGGVFSKGAEKAAQDAADAAVENGGIPVEAAAHSAAPLTETELAAKYGNGYVPPQPGSLEEGIQGSQMPDELKQNYIKRLTDLKDNAPIIKKASESEGIQAMPGMLVKDRGVQDIDSYLNNSGLTPAAQATRDGYDKVFNGIEKMTDESLGPEISASKAQMGEKLEEGITSKFQEAYGPIKELYSKIEEYAPLIPITDRSSGSISNNILKIISEKNLIKGTAEHNFIETMADGFKEVKNLQGLKNLRASMNRSTDEFTEHIAGVIGEKLDNLEINAIKRFATTMKSTAAKENILGLIDTINEASSKYKELRQGMNTIGEQILKKKTIFGPKDFVESIQKMGPEVFADRMLEKSNSRLLSFMKTNFPEETQMLSQFRKNELRDSAIKDGRIQPNVFFRKYNSMSSEYKATLFTDAEIKRLDNANVLYESVPKNINPSGTSKAEGLREFIKHPIAGTIKAGGDYMLKAILDHVTNADAVAGRTKLQGLIRLEQITRDTAQAVKNGTKAFLKPVESGTIQHTVSKAPESVDYLSDNRLDNNKANRSKKDKYSMYQKRSKELTDFLADPSQATDQLASNLSPLQGFAPKVTEAMTTNAMKGAQFLASKLPVDSNAPNGLLPHLKSYQPSDAEISKWERYVTAVDHPMSVVKDLKNGNISNEGVEALKAVYPSLYSDITSNLAEHLSELKENLPYQKRIQIGTLFGLPVDASAQPQFIAQMQAIHGQMQSQQKKNDGISLGGAGKMQASNSMMTETQKMLTRT